MGSDSDADTELLCELEAASTAWNSSTASKDSPLGMTTDNAAGLWCACACVCVCVCVCVRECLCVCGACVYVCVSV